MACCTLLPLISFSNRVTMLEGKNIMKRRLELLLVVAPPILGAAK